MDLPVELIREMVADDYPRDSITTAIRAIGYRHGFSAASGDPWDYDCAEMIMAVRAAYNGELARDYAEQYAFGAHRGAEDRAARKAADTSEQYAASSSDDPHNAPYDPDAYLPRD